MPLVNMSIQQLLAVQNQDEFARGHLLGYISMLRRNKNFGKDRKAQNSEEIAEFQQYETLFKEFRGEAARSVSNVRSLSQYCILFYRILYYSILSYNEINALL